MEPNTKNELLIARALAGQGDEEPGGDFTRRVMERIGEDALARERLESRLLLAAAVVCALGLAGGCVWAVGRFADAELFESLRMSFSGSNAFYLGLCCYTAVLFVALAAAGPLLHRKLYGVVEK